MALMYERRCHCRVCRVIPGTLRTQKNSVWRRGFVGNSGALRKAALGIRTGLLGRGTIDPVRAAIQVLSGAIRQERMFAHLGWRQHGPNWVYLHATGAMGADGPRWGCRYNCRWLYSTMS